MKAHNAGKAPAVTVEELRARAVKVFPELAVAGTAINPEAQKDADDLYESADPILEVSCWPELVARKVAAGLGTYLSSRVG